MSSYPTEQIQDAHKLEADGEIFLYELTPSVGGTIYFKSDNSYTFQGNEYEGVPLSFSGDSRSTDAGTSRPTLTLGDQNLDLGPFKPLLFDGYVDGALIVRRRILRTSLELNLPQTYDEHYTVRQVVDYSRSSISLELARASDSLGFTFPFHQYYAPDFPTVLA